MVFNQKEFKDNGNMLDQSSNLRFQLISDVHGRFNNVEFDKEADIILCAGDVSEKPKEIFKFFKKQTAPIIYIPGNHEFYQGNYSERLDFLQEQCAKTNGDVIFADNKIFEVDNVRIISSTLWTDFDNFDPLLVCHSDFKINDYNHINVENFFENEPDLLRDYQFILEQHKKNIRGVLTGSSDFNKEILRFCLNKIRNKYKLKDVADIKQFLEKFPFEERKNNFSPAHSYTLNKRGRDFLIRGLTQPYNGKTIVMTHHVPTFSALSMSGFAVDVKTANLNPYLDRDILPAKIGAYVNDMEDFAQYNFDAWVHGHLHERLLYRLGKGVVHANPTGVNRNNQDRVGLKTYSFYLNEENKVKGKLNLINHTLFVINKLDEYFKKLLTFNERELIQIMKDKSVLKGIYKEIFYLVRTLKTIPVEEGFIKTSITNDKQIVEPIYFELVLDKFRTFYEREEGDWLATIKCIIEQNQMLREDLNNWRNFTVN